MAPALDITLVGQEMAACAALGAALGGARALFPEKGRAAFLPDVLLVGALLLGLQSYAAALSAGGVLRWYQLAAAVLAAAAVHKLLRGRCGLPGRCCGHRCICLLPGGRLGARHGKTAPVSANAQNRPQKTQKRTCQDHSGCCIILTYQSKSTGASGLLISGGTEL